MSWESLRAQQGDTILANNVYECMFLLDSNRYARDPNGVSGQIPTMIEKAGGEILASRLWNEQRLAYPIRGQRKGAYWLTYFRMETEKVVGFNRACQLNDNVLRNLTLRVDPRLVETLVAHARGETVPPAEEAPAETAPAKEAAAEKAPAEATDAKPAAESGPAESDSQA